MALPAIAHFIVPYLNVALTVYVAVECSEESRESQGTEGSLLSPPTS